MNKIKVMLVDDQLELANELKNILQTDEGLEVVAVAKDGFDGLTQMQQTPVDVVLMDIRMPNMNGVVATERIKTEYPQTKVLILTTFDDSDYILNAINNGASGYLLKNMGSQVLIDAVKNAYKGDTILPAQIAKRIVTVAKNLSADREMKLSRAFTLSGREVEIAIMMYEGFTNRQISSALKLTEGTTRNYVSTIYEKTKTENRNGAIAEIQRVFNEE